MVGCVVVRRHGGPESLGWEERELPPPAPGEVRVRHTAIGLNFIDVYHRTGLYPVPAPFVPGMEACGVVEGVGDGVSGLAVGDRVAYASPPLGAYAEARNMPASRVVVVPAGVSDSTAAGMMLKGMTAEYLLHRTYPVTAGDTVLVHAAAGGVGLILCQWAKHLGATVIGTAGTEQKAALALEHGCDHVLLHGMSDLAERVRHLTEGAGVRVVYDSVGRDTFDASLASLATRGTLVLFGQSSGKVPPLDPLVLNARGSLYLTRPAIAHYTATRDELTLSASRLFEVVERGAVKVRVNQSFRLREAARAHAELEARHTTGSTVLVP